MHNEVGARWIFCEGNRRAGLRTVNSYDLLDCLVSATVTTLLQVAALKEFGLCRRDELGKLPT